MNPTRTTLEPRPPIDPRILRRRTEVRRSQGRRRLRFLVAAVAMTSVAAGGWAATRSALLDVDRVHVEGSVRVAAPELQHATGIRPGTAMVDIDEAAAETAVERLPWVKEAWVARHWPGTVSIHIVERDPVAAISTGGTWALVDETGFVIAHHTDRGPAVPLEGVVAPRRAGTTLPDEALPLVQAAAAVPADLARRVEALAATTSGPELRLRPEGPVGAGGASPFRVRLGGADRLWEKFAALRAVLAGADLTGLASVDLRLPENPVLTRGPKP